MSVLARPRTLSRIAALAGIVLVGSMTMSGCGTIQELFGGGPERDAETEEITAGGEADVFTLRVGDCFNDQGDSGEISSVPAVPCAEPHDNEVFASHLMPDGEFPGQDAIGEFAIEKCDADFATFVGIAWEESELEWYPVHPTEGSWENGNDREVLCTAYDPAGPVEGSLQNAAR